MSISTETSTLTGGTDAGEAQATAALAKSYPFTTTLDIDPVDNAAHWHQFTAEFYLLSGDLQLTDVASGKVHHCTAGTRVTVPERVVHAEHSTRGYRVVLGTSTTPDQFGDPVDRPVSELTS